MELYKLTINETKQKIIKKEVKATEVLESIISRINKMDDQINSYLTITSDMALKMAEEIDCKISKGEEIGNLAGITMAIKDNICTDGILTSCASRMLENFVPTYSATAYEELLKSGAVMLGKTNMDEFAMGSSTESSYFKNTKNPFDTTRVPGGSSGGSAAVVGAHMAHFSLGSDTGGSVRQPAAFCGVIGLKPTYGLVSRYGLVAMANSLDQIGPITKDVTDCALVLNEIAGYDSKDGTSSNREKIDYTSKLDEDVKGLKIGIPIEYFDTNLSEPVRSALMDAIKVFRELGIVCEEVSMPHTQYSMAVYFIIAQVEASLNLARFDGFNYGHRTKSYNNIDELFTNSRTEGFGDEVKRRIMMGTHWLTGSNKANYYEKANMVRQLIKEDCNRVLSKYDAILTPVAPTTAFELGLGQDEPFKRGKIDGYTVGANLAGIPAISISCGTHQGLPIGMQLMGRAFDEETLLQIGRAFEKTHIG